MDYPFGASIKNHIGYQKKLVESTLVMIFAQDDQFQIEKSKMLVSRNSPKFHDSTFELCQLLKNFVHENFRKIESPISGLKILVQILYYPTVMFGIILDYSTEYPIISIRECISDCNECSIHLVQCTSLDCMLNRYLKLENSKNFQF